MLYPANPNFSSFPRAPTLNLMQLNSSLLQTSDRRGAMLVTQRYPFTIVQLGFAQEVTPLVLCARLPH